MSHDLLEPCLHQVENVFRDAATMSEHLDAPLGSHYAGLAISMASSFGVAFLVPEPANSPDAGRLILTGEEKVTAFFGGFLTFMSVLGFKCLNA